MSMKLSQVGHGHFIKSMVYGGVDGIITTFAVVASGSGASLSIAVLIILGVGSLVADAISMGFGDYLSSRAEHEFQEQRIGQGSMTNIESHTLAVKRGLYTFTSFIIFGSVPLMTYIIAPFSEMIRTNKFFFACFLTGATLFVLGALKTQFTKKNWLKSGFEMLSIGGLCAIVAYLVGHILAGLVNQ